MEYPDACTYLLAEIATHCTPNDKPRVIYDKQLQAFWPAALLVGRSYFVTTSEP